MASASADSSGDDTSHDFGKSNSFSPINYIFVFFILASVLIAAYTGRMNVISDASFRSAKSAVDLSINLIGIMALWLGLVRVLEVGGLLYSLARAMRPIMKRLFPDVPEDHPAMGAMLLNFSANFLGLGNAATPFGIKAMVELKKLAHMPGTASNAMCLFIAINTSSVTLLPLGVIGVRAAAGSAEPAGIFLTTLIATISSTLVAIIMSKFFAALDHKNYTSLAYEPEVQVEVVEDKHRDLRGHKVTFASKLTVFFAITAFLFAVARELALAESPMLFLTKDFVSFWLMPALILFILCYGMLKGVKIYEAVTDGAKQGFEIAIKIIPYLVAILVAIGMFRAAGGMDILARLVLPITNLIGLPAEVLPLALVRPMSGTGAFGVMSAIVEASPDSYNAFLASTMMGSTETTFYVMAVYFGAVGVHKVRHALWAALAADITGIIVSCLVCQLLWSYT